MKSAMVVVVAGTALLLATLAGRATNQPAQPDLDGPVLDAIGRMTAPRATHQAALLRSGELLITGGCTGMCDGVHASAEIFDPDTRTFRPAPPMREPRAGHVAVSLADGRVLVAGGWNGRSASATAEVFDPRAAGWSSVGGMGEARMNPVVATLPDGRILVAGGTLRAGHPLSSAEVFDPVTATFSGTGSMTMPRGMAVATSLHDGRVLVTGGHDGSQKLRSVEIFDPATETFHFAGLMAVPRDRHAAVLLPDARVLVIAGQGPGRPAERYTSTEIYDAATGGFTSGPSLQWGRQKIIDAVVVHPSGAVLVAGGWQQPEIWQPGAAEFTAVKGEMYGRHEFATATLLSSGDVLVLGGYAVRPAERSAEAWLVRVPEGREAATGRAAGGGGTPAG